MPSVATGSITVSSAAVAVDDGAAGEHNWLFVRQPEIPEEHKIATLRDASAMLNQLRSGRSAFAAIKSCPVRRSQASGVWTASYTAEVEVHHAEGVEYELEITKDGVLLDAQGPLLSYKQTSESYDVDYNQTQQLGWRAAFNTFMGMWEGDVFDEESNLLVIKPGITHDDGFVYIDAPAFGTFRARGLVEYDLWKVNIEHQLGTEWAASLWAVAWWPKGLAREFQKSEYCEIKLPQCVVDAMNECPDAKADDGTGEGGDEGTETEDHWTVSVNPPRTAEVNKCNGEVEKITYDSK
jgi:hypothetical protein